MQASSTTNDAATQLARTESYLASDPGNTDLLARAIDQSLAAGDPQRAQHHVEQALARYPDDPFFRYRQAHVLSARGQWQAAAPLYAALLSDHPDVNIAYSLANCHIWLGRHQQALDALAPYREQPDLSADSVTLLVRALHHTGELRAAIDLAEHHRERLAAQPQFLGAAALACLDEGELEQAARYSAAALACGVRGAEALVVDATLALADARTADAAAGFQEVIAGNPREGRSWSGLGMTSLLQRDLGQAQAQLEQAVTLMPGHIGTWHCLGWCQLFRKDVAGAERSFAQALELDRNFGESHGACAVAAAVQGQREAAEAAIERALRLDRQSLAARYAQMVLAGETADPERFRALAMKVMGARVGANGVTLSDQVSRHVGQ